MRTIIFTLLAAMTLPVFAQVDWQEATVADMAAGTAGAPVVVTPRRSQSVRTIVSTLSTGFMITNPASASMFFMNTNGTMFMGSQDDPAVDNSFIQLARGHIFLQGGSAPFGGSESHIDISDGGPGTGQIDLVTDDDTGHYTFGGFGGVTFSGNGQPSLGAPRLTLYESQAQALSGATNDAWFGAGSDADLGMSLHLFANPSGNVFLEGSTVVVTNNFIVTNTTTLKGPVTNQSTVYLPTNTAPFNYPTYSFATGQRVTMTDKGTIVFHLRTTNTLGTEFTLWVTNMTTHNYRQIGGGFKATPSTNIVDTVPLPFSVGDLLSVTNVSTPGAGFGAAVIGNEVATGP